MLPDHCLDRVQPLLRDPHEPAYLVVIVVVDIQVTHEPFLIVAYASEIVLHDFAALAAVLSAFHSLILMYASPSGGIGSRLVMISR